MEHLLIAMALGGLRRRTLREEASHCSHCWTALACFICTYPSLCIAGDSVLAACLQ